MMAELKLDLIDSNAAMPTRRNQNMDRERLSDQAPEVIGDAIVRSHTKMKYEKMAEMTISLLEIEGVTARQVFCMATQILGTCQQIQRPFASYFKR
jgi:hypothetical protein